MQLDATVLGDGVKPVGHPRSLAPASDRRRAGRPLRQRLEGGRHPSASHYTQYDERTSWFYEAVGVSVGMMGRTVGAGQVYLESSKDRDGQWLDGGRSYHLRVPPNAPVAQFWSFTVYDNETRCFVDTGVPPDRSSHDNIVKNPNGSLDLYFGPTAPAGKPQTNWIKTIPGKGWFTYFRLYGPTQPYFDRTWVLPDVEVVK